MEKGERGHKEGGMKKKRVRNRLESCDEKIRQMAKKKGEGREGGTMERGKGGEGGKQ